MFKQKKVVHKQSKYFTLMLVPYSSSKIKSIKIPYFMIHTFFVGVFSLMLISFLVSRINFDLRNTVDAARIDLETTLQLNDSLLDERDRIQDELVTERERIQDELLEEQSRSMIYIQRQRENYENAVDYYGVRIQEFNERILELERLRDHIYNQLSTVDLPSAIANNLVFPRVQSDVPEAQITLLNVTQNVSSLDMKIEAMDYRLDSKFTELNDLQRNLNLVRPFLESHPSIWPVQGRITSEVGYRRNPFGAGSEFHTGIDIAVPTGTPVMATGAGVVIFSGWNGGYGNLVIIDHGHGITTRYAHNSRLQVNVGDRVSRRDIIALSGNTGRSTAPHVHYEVRLHGEVQNPRDFIGGIPFFQ